jgi:chromosome segregation ATPase
LSTIELNSLKSEIKQNEDEIMSLKKSLENVNKTQSEVISKRELELKDELSRLNDVIKRNEDEFKKSLENISKRSNVSSTGESLSTIELDILKSDIKRSEDDILSLRKSIESANKAQLDAISKRESVLKAELDRLNYEIKQNEEEFKKSIENVNKQSNVSFMKNELENLKAQIKENQVSVTEFIDACKKHDGEIPNIQFEIKNLNSLFKSINEQNNAASKGESLLKAELNNLKAEIEQINLNNESVFKQLSELYESIHSFHNTHAKNHEKSIEYERQINELYGDVDALKEQIYGDNTKQSKAPVVKKNLKTTMKEILPKDSNIGKKK